ncbi:hypothetical protein SNEBB_003710 [Seison nebaliae]|nr:hypothetical protein SNEBB_003710 [Seison nebaliae]
MLMPKEQGQSTSNMKGIQDIRQSSSDDNEIEVKENEKFKNIVQYSPDNIITMGYGYYEFDMLRVQQQLAKTSMIPVNDRTPHRYRMTIVDWIVEVCDEYSMHTEVAYLAVAYADRYLSKREIPKNKLQLLAIACILIAAKYEEIYPPEMSDCIFVTEKSYDASQICQMEISILKEIDFKTAVITPLFFMKYYLKKSPVPIPRKIEFLIRFVLEYLMGNGEAYYSIDSGMLTAATIYFACTLYNETHLWSRMNMTLITGYKFENVKEAHLKIKRELPLGKHHPRLKNIVQKFCDSRFLEVGKLFLNMEIQ